MLRDPPSGPAAEEAWLRQRWAALVLVVLTLLAALGNAGLAWVAGFAGLAAVVLLRQPASPRIGKAEPTRSREDIRGLLRAALDAVPAPVLLLDHREVILHANASAISAFPALRTGFPLMLALRDRDVMQALAALKAGQGQATAEFVERYPIERNYTVTLRWLSEREDQAFGRGHILMFMVDMTAARRLDAMRSDFVANASHELRTPLSSIIGFAETLQGPAANDEAARRQFLALMVEQGRRMARLIDDLLSLSRIELNEHIPPTERVETAPLIGHVVDLLKGLARERGVELAFHSEEGQGPVRGHRDELVRLFENLIENAIKYGQSGKRVDIHQSVDAEWLKVDVRDFGPGIAAEHLPRLTERFYRADVETSRIQGGTGLGLAIVKHIISRHRGRLEIESKEGEGSVFRVYLPLEKT